MSNNAHPTEATASNRNHDSLGAENTSRPQVPEIDPFDPARLRISQDFVSTSGVKKVLLTVPVRKPDRQSFIRVHPSEDFRLSTAVIELKEDREIYLVEPNLLAALPGDIVPMEIFTAINRQGDIFLFPVRLPVDEKRKNEWSRTLLLAAQMGMKRWVRIAANMQVGAYDVSEAISNLPDPTWPDVSFKELLQIAFEDRFIHTLDHPVIGRLHGKI